MKIAKHSKWVTSGGRIIEVVGIWATGSGLNYAPVAYEIKGSGETIKTVERDVLVGLIASNKIKQLN